MSYQVLARKWRPKNFQELRGQEHVSRALVNAIESGRLHHAYLFTGTRGVGKTTIARILSKCLNCEANGITATPCGECGSCSEIDEGRFVDLIEVDAASRTKVDDTRELLENVQYRPTRGRYKVYLIDEVHMLSNSSFNALLKTLEEPPEHVIFLLATTDPQKLPVTVLSRCLQFHLKHMDEETISNHLQFILEQESIDNEPAALGLIAQSAEGSMRDALSLLDQAIAYGQGKVLEDDIRTMLGTIDHKFMVRLLEALVSQDSVMAIKAIDDMSHYPVDFADALKELLSRLHQIAVYQATQVTLDSAATYIPQFAEIFESADIQMYYQLGLHARRDLEWAPTAKQGLEMALLRMLAFRLDTDDSSGSSKKKVKLTSEAEQSTDVDTDQAAKVQVDPSSENIATKDLATEKKIEEKKEQGVESEPRAVSKAEQDEQSLKVPPPEASLTVTQSTKEQSEQADEPDTDSHQSSTQNLNKNHHNHNDQANEFSGYEQFLQQEERDDDSFEANDFSSLEGVQSSQVTHADKEQPAEKKESIQSTNTIDKPRIKTDSEDDDAATALASLHSALGLTIGQASEPQASERNTAFSESEASLNQDALVEDEAVKDEAVKDRHDEDTSAKRAESNGSEQNENLPQSSEMEATLDHPFAGEPVLNEQVEESTSENDSTKREQVFEMDSDIERLKRASEENHFSEEQALELSNESETIVESTPDAAHESEAELIGELDASQEAIDWANVVEALELDGTYHQIAQSSCAVWSDETHLALELPTEQEFLLTETAKSSIEESLEKHFDKTIAVEWRMQEPSLETPAMIWQHLAALKLQTACQDLDKHPFSQQLQQQFGARIDRDSVTYLSA